MQAGCRLGWCLCGGVDLLRIWHRADRTDPLGDNDDHVVYTTQAGLCSATAMEACRRAGCDGMADTCAQLQYVYCQYFVFHSSTCFFVNEYMVRFCLGIRVNGN